MIATYNTELGDIIKTYDEIIILNFINIHNTEKYKIIWQIVRGKIPIYIS